MSDNSKTKNLAGYIFLVVGMILVVMILVDDRNKRQMMAAEVRKNFHHEISGIVASIGQNRGTLFLHLKKNPNKTYYFYNGGNSSLSPSSISDFVQRGDSLYKAPDSNELFVFRDRNRYRFVFGKSIE